MVEVGRRLWQREYVAANDGNISCRISENEVLATPTGVSKGFLTPDMIVKCDLSGRRLAGHLEVSSEVRLHVFVYQQRPDVCGIVHAHPPTATGFACAGMALDTPLLPEVVISLKTVPLAPYGTPATEELPASIAGEMKTHDGFLLANHGALTLGRDVMQAYHRMETIEHFAKIYLVARMLGGAQALQPTQVEHLMELRKTFGVEDRSPCLGCGVCDALRSDAQFNGRAPEGVGRTCVLRNVVSQGAEEAQGDAELRELVERVVREVITRAG